MQFDSFAAMERSGTSAAAPTTAAPAAAPAATPTAGAVNNDVDDNVTVANMHAEASAINANNDPMAGHDWS